VSRIEVCVRDRQSRYLLPLQRGPDLTDQGGHGAPVDRDRAREVACEFCSGVPQRGQQEASFSTGRQLFSARACHAFGNDDVGPDREVRAVRFNSSDGKDRDRMLPVRIADFLSGHFSESVKRHGVHGRGQN